jgi:CheY-like chemotaxis protein
MSKQIVVAEDSDIQRERLGLIMRRAGYEVFEALHGKVALDHIKSNSIDLLVTDMGMPVMDGYSLVQSLAELGYQIPIIVHAGQKFDASYIPGYRGKIVCVEKGSQDEAILLQTIKELVGE